MMAETRWPTVYGNQDRTTGFGRWVFHRSANGDAGDKPRLDRISKKLNLDRYIELITGPHHSG